MNLRKPLNRAVTIAVLTLSSWLPTGCHSPTPSPPAPLEAHPSKGTILIVLSSETSLPLRDGKTFETGYYLNELAIPARELVDAGYTLVFADPRGNAPVVDGASVSVDYFGGNRAALDEAQRFLGGLPNLAHPRTLTQIVRDGLDPYMAIFVPGGPAPMIDLMASRELGVILRYFHEHQRTTVLLCHGPIALLAAARDPAAIQAALRAGQLDDARALTAGWPYAGYRLTIFSDEEEGQAAKNVFHADPQFFPAQALALAGGQISTVAAWHANAQRDRELITGQNPFSDKPMMEMVFAALAESR